MRNLNFLGNIKKYEQQTTNNEAQAPLGGAFTF
jgi:hypothetical protein